jgi:hypothetical protein
MQLKTVIAFNELVEIAKTLPATQWTKLKKEVEQKKKIKAKELELFLLQAPTFNQKQLDTIAATRKAINQWRTK